MSEAQDTAALSSCASCGQSRLPEDVLQQFSNANDVQTCTECFRVLPSDSVATSVYSYFDETGHVLYVGMTSRGEQRLQEHATTKNWWQYTVGCTIEHYHTRPAALYREKSLIERHSPPFNSVYNLRPDAALAEYQDRRHRLERVAIARESMQLTPKKIKQRRRKWRGMSVDQRSVARCVTCLHRNAAPNLDGDCTLCHLEHAGSDSDTDKRAKYKSSVSVRCQHRPATDQFDGECPNCYESTESAPAISPVRLDGRLWGENVSPVVKKYLK